MAVMTLERIKAQGPHIDRAKFDATTEAEIRRHMIEDGEDPDAPLGDFVKLLPVATIRARTSLSQSAFARALCIPIATLQNWEQGRVTPDPAAQALLRIVAHDHEAAFRALAPRTRRPAVNPTATVQMRPTEPRT
jgi:putative transcriptional regulator